MKKQTAVVWLVKKLNQEIDYIPLNKWVVISDIIQEALAMERDQHGQTWDAAIHAHDARGHVYARSMCDFDDYYKETYNHHTI
jgi:6-phosphogluconolactonase (cycloisomerase 2 family)